MQDSGVLIVDEDAEYYRSELDAAFPAYTFHAAKTVEEALTKAGQCEVLIARPRLVSPSLIRKMTQLKWIQSTIAGVDGFVAMDLPADVLVTSARGAHGAAMSELAIFSMIALSRRYPELLANQQARHWQKWPQPLLYGKTVVILGVGASAQALAARCGPFGITVLGISSQVSTHAGFREILPRKELLAAAAQADFLVCLIAYSAETHHIVDHPVFAAMKPSGFLINQSRGSVVNEQALMEALVSRRIAGAALDVFEEEPLPREHPLWHTAHVIITPHIGGFGDDYARHALPIVRRNLEVFFRSGLNAVRAQINAFAIKPPARNGAEP